MSVERQDGIVVFICETCGDELDTDETEFADARDVLKEEGWLARRRDTGQALEWEHFCDECWMQKLREEAYKER